MPASVSFLGWLWFWAFGQRPAQSNVVFLLVMALASLPPPCVAAQSQVVSLPTAARLPPGLRTPVREASASARHATSLDEIHAARASLDRLEERQQQAKQVWLVSREDVTTSDEAPSIEGLPADVLMPLDRMLETLRRHLAGAAYAGLQLTDATSQAFHQAVNDRDLAQLQRLARQTSNGKALFETWLATGDVALERGWTSAAAEAWMRARSLAEQMHDDDARTDVQRRETMLAGRAAPLDPCRDSPSLARDTASREPRPITSWQRRWQADLAVDRRAPTTNGHPLTQITVATGHGALGGIICWHADESVHARSLTEGRAPWKADHDGPADARLFPPYGDAPGRAPAWPPQVEHGRLLTAFSEGPATRPAAAAGRRSASRLICLDVAAAAEGRLLWEQTLAAGRGDMVVGPPACGQGYRSEDLAFFCLRGETTDLVAIRLSDGEVLWRRPIGLKPNRARAAGILPRPTLEEDLVIVANDDGSVWALNLAGEIAWVRPIQSSPHPVIATCGTVAVCVDDTQHLLGLDLRTGSLRWEFRGTSTVSWLGREPGLFVAQTADTLVTLLAADGSVLATRSIAEAHPLGEPLLAAGALFWPTRATPAATDTASRGTQPDTIPTVLILNPSTLEPCEMPILLEDHDSRGIVLAADDGWLVASDGTSLQVFSSSPPSNP